jgi:hypothetical protein
MLGVVVAVALASEIAMAKPPEPLEEIFPQTSVIVDAVVVEMKSEEADTDKTTHDIGKQVVVLQVNRVIRGALSDADKKTMKIVVTKPKAPYKLRVGVKGPWLLAVDAKTGERTILGRYGPDSWSFEKIDKKLAELNPPHLKS